MSPGTLFARFDRHIHTSKEGGLQQRRVLRQEYHVGIKNNPTNGAPQIWNCLLRLQSLEYHYYCTYVARISLRMHLVSLEHNYLLPLVSLEFHYLLCLMMSLAYHYLLHLQIARVSLRTAPTLLECHLWRCPIFRYGVHAYAMALLIGWRFRAFALSSMSGFGLLQVLRHDTR